MKKIISILLLLTTAILFTCRSQYVPNIKEIKSFKEVDFETISQNTLVIFDVDETLIQPRDAYLINEQTSQGEAFRNQLLQQYPDIKDWAIIASIMLKEADRPLIEPAIIDIINALKKRNIAIIACTGMNTGKYGTLPSMEQWRYENLKSLGFEGSFDDIIIDFESTSSNKKPVFFKGILATDTESKGPIIGAFLDTMQLNPNAIIMFDDSLNYLISVQEECKKRNILFTGYHYKGAIEKPWNEKLFKIQAAHLIEKHKWLNDQQASNYLQNH